jgi:hypothetical protein
MKWPPDDADLSGGFILVGRASPRAAGAEIAKIGLSKFFCYLSAPV